MISLKNHAALVAILMSRFVCAEPTLGLIGGLEVTNTMTNTGPAYAAVVAPTALKTPIFVDIPIGFILGVAINTSGLGIIGGQQIIDPMLSTTSPYAAFVSSSGITTLIPTGIVNGGIFAVAINGSGQSLIGGQVITDMPMMGDGPAYAAFVSPSSIVPTPISTGLPNASISAAAINASGHGFIGGRDIALSDAYVAFVSTSSSTATQITTGIVGGSINNIAINASGQGIIVGNDGASVQYAAIVSSSSTMAVSIPLGIIDGGLIAVAINDSGQGLIGGSSNLGANAYAARVFASTATAYPISLGIAAGNIVGASINSSSHGLLGGIDNVNGPYAAFVSPDGIATRIALGHSSGIINSVAINEFGQGLIGGTDTTPGYDVPYAAIVFPSGLAIPLNIGLTNGAIYSVAILNLIPTESLSGNNLVFANYINENAPQNAIYFVPAFYNGTLEEALESAAPIRNGASFYTATSNLFYLTGNLSTHLRNHSSILNRRSARTSNVSAAAKTEDQLVASLFMPKKSKPAAEPCAVVEPCEEKNNGYSIWFDAIGALAYQQEQNETAAFHPSTGGAVLAFDGAPCQYTRVGGGASYLFTHISESRGSGHSNINQENLFLYASWDNQKFYVDGALFGGLFQMDQVRKIHMTGFDFKASSDPSGWQLLPHIELGYNLDWPNCAQDFELIVDPFIMVDWANAWQGSYKEKGSGPFITEQKHHYASLLRTEVGFRFYEILFFECWNLVFQEKGSYVNTQSFGAGKVNAFLIGSPGSFTVETLSSAQNLGVAQFMMIFAPHNPRYPSSTIFYQGEFGTKYQSHQLNLEFAWNF